VNVIIERVTAALRAPFVSARGSVVRRELLLLRLEGRDGGVGFGEAAPLPDYDGVGIERCLDALEDCRAVLTDSDGDDRESLLTECSRLAVLPQALAAIDLALWDLAGRRAARPVWRLLGASEPPPLEVNYTVSASDRAGAAAEASAAHNAGYGTLKLKVGTGDDAGRLAAVRAAAGPNMAIRLDANGAWSVAEAEAALGVLSPARIELCEEPVRGVEEIAELSSRTAVPVAMDETSIAPGALKRRLCDAVCLKISRGGGISGTLEAARRARLVGYQLYLASTLDGPLGIAAAIHAAAALAPDLPCGLATLGLFADRADPMPPQRGHLRIPREPGLGDGLSNWYSG
jgi:L-alanine-DL-glutamate epimerase-like enolase superfamily enzyme